MKNQFIRFRLFSLLAAVAIVAACLSWYLNYVAHQPNLKLVTFNGSLAMSPTITREILVADFNAYRKMRPSRWEIVVLNPRERSGGDYVADVLRVIGLPGETVSISEGDVIINGHPIPIPEQLRGIEFSWPLCDTESGKKPFIVPDGHYFLLGDNPKEARDSREVGAFSAADIRGRLSGQVPKPHGRPF